MPAAPDRAKSVFLAALEVPAGDARAAHVAAACGGDEDVRREVEQLLRHHEAAGAFLDPPAEAPAETADRPATGPGGGERAGMVLAGRYKLLERVGEGGMGTVWTAQQTEPVKRLVAVKLIKPGMDSGAVLARFEAERQALALMDHPNIARVLDAGAAPDGRPFFVMELVKGVPITAFCDERRLTPRERLGLFVPVCQAIQHAHQKGVIHRDLKPSNVLVALYDGVPVPKVIDFGVAKAAGQPLTDKTLHTGLGAVVGTPEYMSPEQASLNNLDVDTRSDVYSLGVLLYELLAGSPPFSREGLEKAGLLEVLRVVREQDPPRPSTKLSTAEGLPTLAANRGTEPAKLTRLVRGELDWIVMKALEKDRSRRYETAVGLAADLGRYLADEPVRTCPPSAAYRLRKFARRNRGPVAAALGLVAMLVVTLVLALYSNARIGQTLAERNTAYADLQGEQRKTDEARRAAEQREAEIRDGLEKLSAANVHLERGLMRLRNPNQPSLPRAAAAPALEAFDRAIGLRPDHSMARDARGQFFCRLGLFDEAAPDLERAYALRPPGDARLDDSSYDVWFRYACLRVWVGDLAGYRAVCTRMMDDLGRSPDRGAASYWAAGTCGLAPRALADPDRAVRAAEEPSPAEPKAAGYALGMALYRAGRPAEAARRLGEVAAGGAVWDGEPLLWVGLALVHHRLGDAPAAKQWLGRADRWLDRVLDAPNDPYRFALPMQWWQSWIALELVYREAVAAVRGAGAPGHPAFDVVRARGYGAIGRGPQAARALAGAVRLKPDDPRVRLACLRSFAFHQDRAGAARERDALLRLWPADPAVRLQCGGCAAEVGWWAEAAADYGAAFGLRHHDDPAHWLEHAALDLKAGDVAGYRRRCALMLDRFGGDPSGAPLGYAARACVLGPDALGDPARVVRLAQKYLATPGLTPADAQWTRHTLSLARYRAGQYDLAARECRGLLDQLSVGKAPMNAAVLAMSLHRLGWPAEAGEALARARALVRSFGPAGDGREPVRPSWYRWRDWVALQLLLTEAEALLRDEPPARPEPSSR